MFSYVAKERKKSYDKAFKEASISYSSEIRYLKNKVKFLEQDIEKLKCNETLLYYIINFLVEKQNDNTDTELNKYKHVLLNTKRKRIKKKYLKKIIEKSGGLENE